MYLPFRLILRKIGFFPSQWACLSASVRYRRSLHWSWPAYELDFSVSMSSKLPGDRVRLLNSYSACVGTYTFPFYIETTTIGHFNICCNRSAGLRGHLQSSHIWYAIHPCMVCTQAPTSELDVGINAAELSLCWSHPEKCTQGWGALVLVW